MTGGSRFADLEDSKSAVRQLQSSSVMLGAMKQMERDVVTGVTVQAVIGVSGVSHHRPPLPPTATLLDTMTLFM